MALVRARSASRQVKEWLGEGQASGRVLAAHARACNLVAGQGEVIALVAPEIGDGPLNIVLEEWPRSLSGVQSGTRVIYGPDRLVLDASEIDLYPAVTWEPGPDWGRLRARRAAIESSLVPLVALCRGHEPANVLLSFLGTPSPVRGRSAILATRLCEAAWRLHAGWNGDEGALAQAGTVLAGLGEGLTPAGDDFLVGVMLWAWLAHPRPLHFCRVLSEPAFSRTTTLSVAFLKAAARGQCSVAWHRLLAALAEGRAPDITEAAQGVLAHGASSGLDALIGFLYLSQDKEDTCR